MSKKESFWRRRTNKIISYQVQGRKDNVYNVIQKTKKTENFPQIYLANRNLPEKSKLPILESSDHFSFSPSKSYKNRRDEDTTKIFDKNELEEEEKKDEEEDNIFETKMEKRVIKHFSQNYSAPQNRIFEQRGQPQFKTDVEGSPLKKEIADKMIDILHNLGNTGKKFFLKKFLKEKIYLYFYFFVC